MKITKVFEDDDMSVEVRTIKVKQVKSIMQTIVRVLKLETIEDAATELNKLSIPSLFDNFDTVISIVNESVVVHKISTNETLSVEELDIEQVMELVPALLEVNQCFLEPLMSGIGSMEAKLENN